MKPLHRWYPNLGFWCSCYAQCFLGGYFCHSPWTHTLERLGTLTWNLNHANKTSLETFLAHSILKSEISVFDDCLVSFLYCLACLAVIFANSSLYSINQVAKRNIEKIVRIKSTMTHECHFWNYNRVHNILELEDIFVNVCFTTSETVCDYY